MRDTITGCPERALEPPERADQERLNRLQDMREGGNSYRAVSGGLQTPIQHRD